MFKRLQLPWSKSLKKLDFKGLFKKSVTKLMSGQRRRVKILKFDHQEEI